MRLLAPLVLTGCDVKVGENGIDLDVAHGGQRLDRRRRQLVRHENRGLRHELMTERLTEPTMITAHLRLDDAHAVV